MEYETISDTEAETRVAMQTRVAEAIKQATSAEIELARWESLKDHDDAKVAERAVLTLPETQARAKSFQAIAVALTKKFKPKRSDVEHWRTEHAKSRIANAEREHAHNSATLELLEAALAEADVRDQERKELQAQVDNLNLMIALADADHAYAKKVLAGQGTVKASPKKKGK